MNLQRLLEYVSLTICSIILYACGAAAPTTPPPSTPVTFAAVPKAAPTQKASGKLALGYYTGSQSSITALQSFTPFMNIVSVDVFTVRMDGSIAGNDILGATAYAQANNIQSYACINNYNSNPAIDGFDPALVQAAIVTHKQAVIPALVSLAKNRDYQGINIDLENLTYSSNIENDRSDFTLFIHELADQLHANGIKLMISVPGKTADSKDNPWAYPFDLAALGQDADYLQLMTYDLHGPWSEPGPVSDVDWVEECIVYAAALVNPSKLLIGLPAYGYDWNLTDSDQEKRIIARDFSWTEIPVILTKPGAVTRWDVYSQSPSVTYTENGHDHVAWYENPDSIRAKTKLVKEYNLAGFSMWSLGQEDQSFWQAAVEGMK